MHTEQPSLSAHTVRVDTTDFVREHGESPRGYAGWSFLLDGSERIALNAMRYSEAKQVIRKLAAARGISRVALQP